VATLQTYLTECRRLLHDAVGNFWSDPELIDYINQGRQRVAADTGCSRRLVTLTLNVQSCTGTGSGGNTITGVSPVPDQTWVGTTVIGTGLTGTTSSSPVILAVNGTTLTISGTATAGALSFTYYQEAYPFTSVAVPSGQAIIDVLNITSIWNNTRYVLNCENWTLFNARMRSYLTFQQRPTVYSIYGQNTVYIGPIVDQAYVTEWDCVLTPADLVSATDVEPFTFPFTTPVSFWACYLAKIRDSSWDEAKVFQDEYMGKIRHCIAASAMRRIPNVYAGL
jgi:hypothetical protein